MSSPLGFTVPPSVALLAVIEVADPVLTVGACAAVTVKVAVLEVCLSAFITCTFQVPVMPPLFTW